jgi:hypothetical protein
MIRTFKILIVGAFFISIIVPQICADDYGLLIGQYEITISTSEQGLLIEENIQIKNNGIDNVTSVRFWIQKNNQDIEVQTVESGKILIPIVTDRIRDVNLSKYNLTLYPGDSLDILVSYVLPTDTITFEKTVLYDSSLLSVFFNDEQLYQVQKAQSDSSFSLRLYKPTEAPLSITYIMIIFILVVILIASTLFLLRKQRTRTKNLIVDSKEILTTKKALLLSLLKDLEKQHRSKTISDDTYSKLKDEYKQQAVIAMKKLEELQ